MKTGEQIKEQAFCLLNYTDANGRADSAMYADVAARALSLVNRIYAELWYALHPCGFRELSSLSEEVSLPARVIDRCMVYGVAMLMAQTLGDADNQSMMADLYNQHRAALTHVCRRRDVMPRAI